MRDKLELLAECNKVGQEIDQLIDDGSIEGIKKLSMLIARLETLLWVLYGEGEK